MSFFKNCSARMSACAARPVGRFVVNVGYGVSQRFSLLSTVLVATLLTEALLKRELSPSALNLGVGLFIAIPLTTVFIILEVVRRYLNQRKIIALAEEKSVLIDLYQEMLKERRDAVERNEMLLKEKRHLLNKVEIMLLRREVEEKGHQIFALQSPAMNSAQQEVSTPPRTQGVSVSLSDRVKPFEFSVLSHYETCIYLKEAPKTQVIADTEAVADATAVAIPPLRVLARTTSYQRSIPLLVYKFCLALLQRLPEAACASIIGNFASAVAFQEALFSDTRMIINLMGAAVVGTIAVIASLFELSGLEIQARDEEREMKNLEKQINEEAKELYALKYQNQERWNDLEQVTKQTFTTLDELRRVKALTDTIQRKRTTQGSAVLNTAAPRQLMFATPSGIGDSSSDDERVALVSPHKDPAVYGTPVKVDASPSIASSL